MAPHPRVWRRILGCGGIRFVPNGHKFNYADTFINVTTLHFTHILFVAHCNSNCKNYTCIHRINPAFFSDMARDIENR